VDTLSKLAAEGMQACIVGQNLTEAWAVMTRPASANGLGLSPAQARAEVERILATFSLLPDPADTSARWLELCTTHDVRGRQAFDAKLVAVMLSLGITRLVTLNPVDFARYPAIKLTVPGQEV
jgi:predicted nucleic acid-binding protein